MNREPTPDEQAGMDWWNAQTRHERAYWCRVADSARPVDAWRAHQRAPRDEKRGV